MLDGDFETLRSDCSDKVVLHTIKVYTTFGETINLLRFMFNEFINLFSSL